MRSSFSYLSINIRDTFVFNLCLKIENYARKDRIQFSSQFSLCDINGYFVAVEVMRAKVP